MGKNLVSYGEFYKWKKANKLPEFYKKFSKRPNAQFDEDGSLFICYDSEGRDVWLSPEGEIFGDTYNVYENESDNKVMKHMYRLWNQKPNNRQHLSGDEKTDNLYSTMNGKMSESKNVVKLNEAQLRKVVAESVKRVLKERYLEPGTADYETDKISKELKRFYPQYEDFVDEYVYGGYYERFANRVNPDIRGGFIEFVKSKQGKSKNNQPDRETIDKVAELIDFIDNNKRGYHIEENSSIEELRELLVNWLYKYCPWAKESEMNSAIGG